VLGSRLGLDQLQFQLGASSAPVGATNSFFAGQNLTSYLYNSTIAAGQQFGNFSVNVSSGLCPSSGFRAADMLGAEAAYRFNSTWSTKVGYDPGTQGHVCNASQDFINFVRTPSQFSLSLLQTWRY
jgi:hypothetical protein